MRPEVTKAVKQTGHSLGSVFALILKVIGTILLIFITTGSILAVVFSIYITKYLNVDMDVNLDDYNLNQTSIVYYTDKATGNVFELETLYGIQNRITTSFDEVPPHMIQALVAMEDKRFYQHNGVDWKRTMGGFLSLFSPGKSFGGSTITQQLIKNLTEDKEVTVQRKVQEILRALEFEKKYTKENILEWYLNTSYFGEGCYGVKTAAQTYFGKELKDLTLAQSACIIGITNSPTLYNPYLNPEENKKRQTNILEEMRKQGIITEAEFTAAVNEPLILVGNKTEEDTTDVQSTFVDQIFWDLTDDLMRAKNISKPVAQGLLYGGGYRIYATVDMRIQGIIDDVYQNEENFPVVKNSEKPQSSMLLIDPYTGDILGMAGQRGRKVGKLVRNLATQAQRQPGSAIKPIPVYSAAMDLGQITPYSVVDDAPLKVLGNRNWPKNSGGAYKGRTPIITAVQNSVNTIAVRVVDTMTPQVAFLFGKSLGLNSLVEERVVQTSKGKQVQSDIDIAPLALGGLTKGLSVRELTASYGAFNNRGIYTAPRTYTHVTDSKGEMVLDNRPQTTVAMKEKTAYYMNTVLQQVIKAGTGGRARLENMPVAGKTGTTSEDKDRWFVGYTPYYVAGAWFGFTIPKKITLAQSTNPALAMWKLVMERVHEGMESKDFFTMDGLVSGSYCLDSGLAPTENCRLDPRGSRISSGLMAREDVPRQPCNVHTLVNIDKTTKQLATPYCPADDIGRVALLNLSRGMPAPGVVLGDEQYTTRLWGQNGPEIPAVPEGTYRAVAVGPDGKLPYNSFCTLHSVATGTSITPVVVDPTLPTDPPVIPDTEIIPDVIPETPPTPEIPID